MGLALSNVAIVMSRICDSCDSCFDRGQTSIHDEINLLKEELTQMRDGSCGKLTCGVV